MLDLNAKPPIRVDQCARVDTYSVCEGRGDFGSGDFL